MPGLNRYEYSDAYTLEELRREYNNADTSGRKRLLERLNEDSLIPFEIAVMAVGDPHAEIRQWVGRFARHLDYREWCHINDKWVRDPLHPERDLEAQIKKDSDPFVRACTYENGSTIDYFGEFEKIFKDLTHLERLALVRNPTIATQLVEKIFDSEDKDLHLDIKERAELAFAYLTNKESIERQALDAGLTVPKQTNWDGLSHYYANKFFNQLWLFASKWPKNPRLQPVVYKFLPANDDTKLAVYENCSEPVWRHTILENCLGSEIKTISIGTKDSDSRCRETAYSKANYLRPAQFKEAFESHDKHALRGILRNRSLIVVSYLTRRVENRYSISDERLKELGIDEWYSNLWSDLYHFKKVVGRGALTNLRRMFLERADYLWEKKHPKDIFTALRLKAEEGMKESGLDTSDYLDTRLLYEDLDKQFPPGDPEELFLYRFYEGDRFLGDKLDFLGKNVLRYNSLLSRAMKFAKFAILVLVSIWLWQRLFG